MFHDAFLGAGHGVVADEEGGIEGGLDAVHHAVDAGAGAGNELDFAAFGGFEFVDEEVFADVVAVLDDDEGGPGFGGASDGGVDVVGHHSAGKRPVGVLLVGAAALDAPTDDSGAAFDVGGDIDLHGAGFTWF